jgi:tRNA(His) 5'-end guanylyltransferase
MLGQFYFSHKELQGKNTDQVQEMLFSKHGVNWNDIPTWQKRGYCSTRDGIDDDIPVFTQDRDYIEQHLRADDEW